LHHYASDGVFIEEIDPISAYLRVLIGGE